MRQLAFSPEEIELNRLLAEARALRSQEIKRLGSRWLRLLRSLFQRLVWRAAKKGSFAERIGASQELAR